MARDLRHTDVNLTSGLATKPDPGKVGGGGMLVVNNMDPFKEFGSIGQIPGSSRQSDVFPASVEWVESYEYFNVTGDQQRQQLALSNGQIFKINSDKSLTVLKTGLDTEWLSSAQTLDKIFMCSPGNNPLKYDGATVSRWGVWAPGLEENIVEGFDDETDFTINSTNTKADSTESKDGEGSVQCNKISTATTDLTLTLSGVTWNLGSAGSGQAIIWLNIPAGTLSKLESVSHCVEIGLTSAGPLTDTWEWSLGSLFEGWNVFVLPLGSPDTDGGADINAITSATFKVIFSAATFTQSGFLWDKLYVTDEASVNPVDVGSGSVQGSVTYRVTFISKYGIESNAGPPSASVSGGTAGRKFNLTGIPTSPDSQIIARRVYRDLDGDALWRFVTQLDDNAATEFEDDISGASRGTSTPPLVADASRDNSPPPRMTQVVAWKNYLIGIDAGNKFQINISDSDNPEVWGTLNSRQFDKEVNTLIPHAFGLFIESSDSAYLQEGDTLATFTYNRVNPENSIGCSGKRAFTNFKRIATIWYDDGPYGHDGFEPWYLGFAIRDIVEDLDATAFEDMYIIHDRARYRILHFLQSTAGGDYDTCLAWSYGFQPGEVSANGAGVDPHDVRVGMWSKVVFPATINPRCAAVVEQSADTPEIWIGCDDGYVYRMQDPGEIDWTIAAGTEAVAATLTSSWLPVGDNTSSMPRYLGVSGKTTAKSTWTWTLKAANMPEPEAADVIATNTGTFEVGPGAWEKTIPIPAGSTCEFAQVSLANSGKGEDGVFRDLRIYVIPRRFRGAEI